MKLRVEKAEAKYVGKHSTTELFSRLTYPHIYIPNRGAAIGLSLLPKNHEMIIRLRRSVDEYNTYVDFLQSLPGFDDEMKKARGNAISRETVEQLYGKDIANRVFSLKDYVFDTDWGIKEDYLFNKKISEEYVIEGLPCGEKIIFGSTFPSEMEAHGKKYELAWNWSEDERDFCFSIWGYIQSQYPKWDDELYVDEDVEPVKKYDCFKMYESYRNEMECPDKNMMRTLVLLQNMGYLKVYRIEPKEHTPQWDCWTESKDRTIGLMILDDEFRKNKLAVDRLKLIYLAAESDADKYILTNEKNEQTLSNVPGLFGGHNKLKIYGKLDCPSALRHIKAGKYIQHRVFFQDEETAQRAGYRPCAKCMPEAYQLWKEGRGLA